MSLKRKIADVADTTAARDLIASLRILGGGWQHVTGLIATVCDEEPAQTETCH